ncbi:hypothetical protein ABID39_001462 [Bartonella japonica]|uniref:Uncharacterized protein n=1 Tax=Bartonella japonica TaxID=357761 RepID=A0ABV2FQA9_9HYPH
MLRWIHKQIYFYALIPCLPYAAYFSYIVEPPFFLIILSLPNILIIVSLLYILRNFMVQQLFKQDFIERIVWHGYIILL